MVRTRFAPSPTGELHIGGLRTALYAYALAKHENGDFILRIEDTDKKREVEGSKQKIQTLLQFFGLNWDEYYVQSERLEKYQEAANKLVYEGKAFYCNCQAKNAKEEGYSQVLRDPCRGKNLTSGAIKLKTPDNELVSFHDFILDKTVSWQTSTVVDATLLKSDGYPTYHLAVAVDDTDMQISHVLRGHDWLPSTPIHLLVYQFLGYDLPQIGHLTDILDPEGGKLSKRKGSTSCEDLLAEGYLPEAILNFIMLLGWAPKDNREFFTLGEFVKDFDVKGFQKANPVFNFKKLDWFNGEYLRQLTDGQLVEKLDTFYKSKFARETLIKTIPLVKDRLTTLADYDRLAGFFYREVKPLKVTSNYGQHIGSAREVLLGISDWTKDRIDNSLMTLIKEKQFKTGDFFMDLRATITGSKFTPPINESLFILGKDKTLERLEKGLEQNK